MVYQLIFIDRRRFISEMLRKIKFDSPPCFAIFFKFYPVRMQAMRQIGEGPQNIIDFVKN